MLNLCHRRLLVQRDFVVVVTVIATVVWLAMKWSRAQGKFIGDRRAAWNQVSHCPCQDNHDRLFPKLKDREDERHHCPTRSRLINAIRYSDIKQ